jgi:hypothetical protein
MRDRPRSLLYLVILTGRGLLFPTCNSGRTSLIPRRCPACWAETRISQSASSCGGAWRVSTLLFPPQCSYVTSPRVFRLPPPEQPYSQYLCRKIAMGKGLRQTVVGRPQKVPVPYPKRRFVSSLLHTLRSNSDRSGGGGLCRRVNLSVVMGFGGANFCNTTTMFLETPNLTNPPADAGRYEPTTSQCICQESERSRERPYVEGLACVWILNTMGRVIKNGAFLFAGPD